VTDSLRSCFLVGNENKAVDVARPVSLTASDAAEDEDASNVVDPAAQPVYEGANWIVELRLRNLEDGFVRLCEAVAIDLDELLVPFSCYMDEIGFSK
jgi:hypothetical protein